MEYEDIIQQIIEFLGTFAFAISGIRHAAQVSDMQLQSISIGLAAMCVVLR